MDAEWVRHWPQATKDQAAVVFLLEAPGRDAWADGKDRNPQHQLPEWSEKHDLSKP